MDQAEFHRLLPLVVDGLRSRIPPKFQEGFDEEIEVGEFRMAVANLVIVIVDYSIAVTTVERDRIRDMLVYLREEPAVVDDFVIQPASGSD